MKSLLLLIPFVCSCATLSRGKEKRGQGRMTANKLGDLAVLMFVLAGLFAAAAVTPYCWRSFQQNHEIFMDKCDADAQEWRASVERMQCKDKFGEIDMRLPKEERKLCEKRMNALRTYDAYWCGMGRLMASLGIVRWIRGVVLWLTADWKNTLFWLAVVCALLGIIWGLFSAIMWMLAFVGIANKKWLRREDPAAVAAVQRQHSASDMFAAMTAAAMMASQQQQQQRPMLGWQGLPRKRRATSQLPPYIEEVDEGGETID